MDQNETDYILRIAIDEFKKQMQDVVAEFKKVGDNVEQQGNKMDSALKKVGAAIGSYFAYAQVEQFATSVIRVRSEIEKLQVSFKTLAGEKLGGQLFAEIKEFATTTPLLMNDLASAAQTMLGFGIAADKIIPNLKAIGDISMGDSQRLQSLSLAFSQMTATGKLMGQDLQQMINAGFNPLEEIARKTGKSIGELKDEMSKGAVSADMVRDAFISATSEGGKFNGMLEAQSKTIAGAYSNLQGAIDDAFNAIGEKAQPIILSTIDSLTDLAKNYETVGKAVLTAVEVIGAYKAAELASIAITNAHTIAIQAQTAAQLALNAAAKLNPYVALTAVVLSLAAAIYTWTDRTTAQEKAEKALQERNKALTKEIDDRRSASEKLLDVVTNETKSDRERAEALEKLKQTESAVFAEYGTFIELTNRRTEAQKRLNEALREELDMHKMSEYLNDKELLDAWTAMRNGVSGSRQRIEELYRRSGGKGDGLDATMRWLQDSTGGYEALKRRVQRQDRERSSGAQDSYLASIGSMSMKQMKEEEAEMQRLLNLAKEQNKEYVSINGVLTSRAQLHERIVALQQRYEEQSKTSNPYQAALKQYKDAEEKLKELHKQANSNLTTEARKKLDDSIAEQEGIMKAAKEKLESYGWSDKKKATKADKFNDGWLSPRDYDEMKQRIDKILETNQKAREKDKKEAEKAMRDYLMQFGSYEERRKAIAEEYAVKIADAKNEGEKKLLAEQQKQQLQSLDEQFGRAAQAMSDLFGDASKKSTKEIQAIIDKYKELIEYMQGKKSMESLVDGGNWTQTEANQASNAIRSGKVNVKDLNSVIKQLEDAIKSRNPFKEIEDAFDRIRNAAKSGKMDFRELGIGITEASNAVESYLMPCLHSLTESITNIFGSEAGGVASKIEQGAGAALGLASGAGKFMSGDYLGAAMEAGNFISTLIDIFGGGNLQRLQEEIDDLTESNKDLQIVMGQLEESFRKSTTANAMDNYDRLVANYWAQIANYQGIMNDTSRQWQRGSHSIASQFNDNYRNLLGQAGVSSLEELLALSPERMSQMREDGLYTAIKNAIRDLENENTGQGLTDLMDEYVALAGKLDEYDQNLADIFTGTTFDAVYDNWAAMLGDMESSTKDFANSISTTINKALTKAVSGKYQEQLSDWYADFTEAVKAKNYSLIDQLKQDYMSITQQARQDIDDLKSLGYLQDTSESASLQASRRSIGSITEEQADALNGRVTYLQIATTQIADTLRHQSAVVESYQDLLFDSNQRLRDIADNTRELHEIRETLNDIKNNTSRL